LKTVDISNWISVRRRTICSSILSILPWSLPNTANNFERALEEAIAEGNAYRAVKNNVMVSSYAEYVLLKEPYKYLYEYLCQIVIDTLVTMKMNMLDLGMNYDIISIHTELKRSINSLDEWMD
jgi:hypothetical protein